MRLFDEGSGELRKVELRSRMGVYVCGITPYDAAHLGHAFTYVHFDVLVRYLRHLGVEVTHVQNVTDVDDDMLRVAGERGVDYLELADREVASFESAMEAIGVAPPTHTPRATRFVREMIDEVQALIQAGHGYHRDGTVYFRVASDPTYGRLSRLTREQMLPLAAERGGHPEDPNKEDPLDFVLWQRSAPGEPWWESPWGRGRPGWHIECSTMSQRLLGMPVDIHGGGSDLIYPHHESELAQAEGIPGRNPFVLHWMHTGTVHMAGDKMSKSLGNLAFVDDLLERHPPAALRSFLLRRHYRQDWDFRESDLDLKGGSAEVGDGQSSFDPASEREEFYRALDADLDTPAAMRILDRAGSASDASARGFLEEGRQILGLLPG